MKKESKKKKTYFGKEPEETLHIEKKEKKKKQEQEVFSEDLIYAILEKTPHPLRLDDILRRADVTRRSKREVLAILHDLVQRGKVVHQKGGSYSVSSSLKHIIGKVAIQRSGAAFVCPQKIEGQENLKEDIYIAEQNLDDAWNGDIVEVLLLPEPRSNARGISSKKREGKIVKILERTHSLLTVRLEQDATRQQDKYIKHLAEHAYLTKPTDNRFNFNVLVPLIDEFLQELAETENASLSAGDLVQVQILERLPSRLDRPLWLGIPQKYLGGQNNVSVQEAITKTSNNIPTEFPDDVLAEAYNMAVAEGFLLNDKEQQKLHLPLEPKDIDLRDLCLVTIDGSDSKDFDDAIYVEKNDDTYTLLVAIADVSRYVLPYSRLDKEAKSRGNSYYFPNSVEPMLPEALSNGLCSLRPNEDHRIMFSEIEFNTKGQVKSTRFGQGIMRSKARLTYDVVQELYDTGHAINDPFAFAVTKDVEKMLWDAKELAEILIAKRQKAGSLHLEIPEQRCIIKNDMVVKLGTRPHFFAHELIEAFMVSANEAVAEFLHHKNAPCLYRTHPAPAPERLQSLSDMFASTALAEIIPASDPKKIGENKWLSEILSSLEKAKLLAEQDEDLAPIAKNSYLAHRMILRSMMQARYSPILDIHFGLASQCYCHFTSPIRRYADLMVHRSLKAQLGIMDKKHKIFHEDVLEDIANKCNEQERVAQSAEREVFRRLSCLLLEKEIGKTYTATISGLSNFGIFAEMHENMAEGMIRMEKLGNDYFIYDEDQQILYGQRTGIEYRLGDEVTVSLENVDITRLEIDLSLVGVTPRRPRKKDFGKNSFDKHKTDKRKTNKKPAYKENRNNNKKESKKSSSKKQTERKFSEKRTSEKRKTNNTKLKKTKSYSVRKNKG